MWKPRMLLIPIILIVVVTILALTFAKTGEPSYQGHSLSYWLANAYSEDSKTAVTAIGTNALPWLIRWINYEPPAWRQRLAALALKHQQEGIFELLYGPESGKAIAGFEILGTNALPALPALVQTMKNNSHPQPAFTAIYALSTFGEQALPHLADALSDKTSGRRRAIVYCISMLPRHGASTNACLIPLLKATTDQAPGVRRAATNAILRLAPYALTNTTANP